MADKLVNLRVFADEAGNMNRSLLDVGGSILLVSNFTPPFTPFDILSLCRRSSICESVLKYLNP